MKHIPPTAEQKLKLYQAVRELVVANEYGTRCICQAIYHAQEGLGFVNAEGNNLWSKSRLGANNNMQTNFPELFKLKPVNKQFYMAWWNINEKKVNPARLRAVDKMIAEVQAQLNSF